MILKTIPNQDLLQELKKLVETERRLLVDVLHYLREVEVRKMHISMGYPDLCSFATRELGYSEGAAYRRISAMRLLAALPEVEENLRSGALGLENASLAQSTFRKVSKQRKVALNLQEKKKVVDELLGKSTREGARKVIEIYPEVAELGEEKTQPIARGNTLVTFVATPELMSKLEELKGLLAHKNFDGRLDVLVDQLADFGLQALRPQKSMQPKKYQKPTELQSRLPDRKSPAPGISQQTRYVPVQVKRAVYHRNSKIGCTYSDPKSGRCCGSQYGLQMDHLQPYSWGGSNTAENLTLRCGAHNRFRAEQMGLVRPLSS